MTGSRRELIENRFEIPYVVMMEYIGEMDVRDIRPDIKLNFELNYHILNADNSSRFKTLAESKKHCKIEWGLPQVTSAEVYANIHCINDGSYDSLYFNICGIVDGFEFSSGGPIFSLRSEENVKGLVQTYFVGKHIENEKLLNLMWRDIDLYKTVEALFVKEITRLAKIADEKVRTLKRG